MSETKNQNDLTRISGYEFSDADSNCSHDYLQPAVASIISLQRFSRREAFDVGCGTGAFAWWLSQKGFNVKGVDPSTQGIALAHSAYPTLDLQIGSAYDQLWEKYGTFPLVVSLEVVEHVYSPREYASCIWKLLEPGGLAIVSTPYHGYLKNLALAISGKFDSHFTALWDHGHIKFWSESTLKQLFEEQGFLVERFVRVGRIPALAKSMVAVLRKPSNQSA